MNPVSGLWWQAPATRYRHHSAGTGSLPTLGDMDNDQRSTPPGPDETAEIPWARTTTLPTVDPQSRPAVPGHAEGVPAGSAPPGSAPAVAPPVWSGRKTAIAAALAFGFASVGAVAASAVLPAGSSQTDQGGRGFPGGGRFPGQNGQGQQGQLNQQGVPGGHVPGVPGDDGDDHDDDASTT